MGFAGSMHPYFKPNFENLENLRNEMNEISLEKNGNKDLYENIIDFEMDGKEVEKDVVVAAERDGELNIDIEVENEVEKGDWGCKGSNLDVDPGPSMTLDSTQSLLMCHATGDVSDNISNSNNNNNNNNKKMNFETNTQCDSTNKNDNDGNNIYTNTSFPSSSPSSSFSSPSSSSSSPPSVTAVPASSSSSSSSVSTDSSSLNVTHILAFLPTGWATSSSFNSKNSTMERDGLTVCAIPYR